MGIIKDLLKESLYGSVYYSNTDTSGNFDIASKYNYFNKYFSFNNTAYNDYVLFNFGFTLNNCPLRTANANDTKTNYLKNIFKAVLNATARSVNVQKYKLGSGDIYYVVTVSNIASANILSRQSAKSAYSGNMITPDLIDIEMIDSVLNMSVNTNINLTTSDCNVFFEYCLKMIQTLDAEQAIRNDLFLSGTQYNDYFTTYKNKILTNEITIGLVSKFANMSSINERFYSFISTYLFPKGVLKVEAYTNDQLKLINGGMLIADVNKFSSIIANKKNFVNNFNFLIAVRDHYVKYQSTAFLFTAQGNKDQLLAITSGNFLKLLQTQVSILTPTKYVTSGSLANKTTINADLLNLIRLTTMGYLKSGDVVTSDVANFFKLSDDVAGILNRITAISTVTNNVPVPPQFVYNTIGSIISSTTVPNGAMMIKLINEVLLEADKNFTFLGF